ncbi:HAMP domain-containing histidine kinase [Streptomyces sp. YC504]|uniref:histidine kinase n=1 Tax=Streptomyces mesophilus TaxID=1775132 RepID=A0A6G4XS77_9ACTN|nr:HAMP domain-containing sensor histidine kinase [Streptomyces mesophilus]NGO80446.1 HAMP domain-containing histidine kinase [Streptomyces mesophilus]
MGLRWRIALTITAVSCTVAAVLGVLVHNVVTRQVVGEVRKEVRDELDYALSAYEYGTTMPEHAGIDPPGLPTRLRELAADGRRGTMVGERAGEPVMWSAAPADGKALAVWQPFGATRSRLDTIDTAILGSALLAAGTVTLAGLFLAARISRRLSATAAVARRITDGDLDARVGMSAGSGKGHDEVRDVAAALDSMAESLQRRLESEKRFTADVAHELRTPLTGMVAAAGLLPEGRPKEMINDRLGALRGLTEDLLEISRLDAGAETADLSEYQLSALVEHAVRGTGLEAETEVVRDVTVRTDRRRLDRILSNLIVNSHKHGRPPVTLTVDGPVIEVRDQGDGYPRELVEQGPQRFRTGDPGRGRGHGLGLTIVMGQAGVLGIEVEFGATESGGARTVLRLPAH